MVGLVLLIKHNMTCTVNLHIDSTYLPDGYSQEALLQRAEMGM